MKKRKHYHCQQKKRKSYHIVRHAKKNLMMNFNDDENYCKVRDQWHYASKNRGVVHSICNLRYKTPKQIPVVLHNR